MNVSSVQPCVSICCNQDTAYPHGAGCYWNVSLSSVKDIFPKFIDYTSFSPADFLAIYPGVKVPCPNNTVCYSDCNSGKDIPTDLFGNGITSMNDSIGGGLTCRLDAKEYCFNSHETVKTDNVTSICMTVLELEASITAFAEAEEATRPIYAWLQSITLLFLVPTFLIYTILPELQNLHGLILRTYISCCFVFFLIVLLINAMTKQLGCKAYIMIPLHFVSMATFTWINVMSFDIWWTFRSLMNSPKQSPRKKYILYSIYAWGIPTLIIGIALIIEFLPNAPEGIIKPGLQIGCWMQDHTRAAVYMKIPMTIMQVGNACFFVLATTCIIQQKNSMAQHLEGTDTKRFNAEKSRFYLYLKLFIITGMTWLTEVYDFFVEVELPPLVAWLLQVPNLLQGLIIFILFVCNAEVRRMLTKYLGLNNASDTVRVGDQRNRATTAR